MSGHDTVVHIDAAGTALDADLAVPLAARGLVVFAHGSGSSRFSPRNRMVAEMLTAAGLATVLTDLLTAAEEREPPDLGVLAARVVGVIDWLAGQPATGVLPLGLFGASSGAAAALLAAGNRPERVRAVVCRGGRPDLAAPHLGRVRAPTLLIVGGEDHHVLGPNRTALRELCGPAELHVVPGAQHMFTEPGALEDVARCAAAWFERHLGGVATEGGEESWRNSSAR